jgi:hypothetical protein
MNLAEGNYEWTIGGGVLKDGSEDYHQQIIVIANGEDNVTATCEFSSGPSTPWTDSTMVLLLKDGEDGEDGEDGQNGRDGIDSLSFGLTNPSMTFTSADTDASETTEVLIYQGETRFGY